jgi:hypothetical protein
VPASSNGTSPNPSSRSPPVAGLHPPGPPRSRWPTADSSKQQRNLATYRDNDRIRNLFGDETFLAGVELRRERLRDARLAFGAAQARHGTPEIPPIAELRDTWPELDVLTQRAMLEQLIGLRVRRSLGVESGTVDRARDDLPDRN